MKLINSLIIVALTVFATGACSRNNVQPSSSSAGALTANSAINSLAPRRLERHSLDTAGFHSLSEFIRPEVRARLDEEPAGDSDGGYDPGASETGSSDQSTAETAGEGQPEAQPDAAVPTDESHGDATRAAGKFAWAKKSFGDAVKATPTTNGVIVLYADESYYDVSALMGFVEHGRDRIAEKSAIGGERIQVVYGGYRAVPQVELWIVPEGSAMPEFKPDDRTRPNAPEN